MPSISWPRVALVTLGLMVTGFVAGVLVGTLMLVAISLSYGELLPWSSVALVFMLSTIIGGPIGAIATPLVAWLALRRIPIGRAILIAAAGTWLGGVLTARAVSLFGKAFIESAGVVAVLGALIGFFAAAAWLRFGTRRRSNPLVARP